LLVRGSSLRSRVKILDIGLGRTRFDRNNGEGGEDVTSDDTILGTPDCMAPEQACDARRADIRSNI
jgi:hypothetical protein